MTESIQRDEDRYQLQTYSKLPIAVERGRGCYVYDQHDQQYLDFYSGHAVASTGHCHPHVVAAIQEQASRLIFYSNATYNGIRAAAVKHLLHMVGSPYHQVFLANSGSEANENAIKLARAFTGRQQVISLSGSFHGRTYGSLSSTGIPKYLEYLNTPVPGHLILPVEKVAGRISQQTAAVLLEPIQSMGGVLEISAQHLQQIYQACQEQQALLIFDEVQTGAARTGSYLYAGRQDIFPDMVSLAKGVASGFPAAALLVTKPLAASVKSGDLGATFGGGPLACAALKATLEVIEKEKLAENAKRMGLYLKQALSGLPAVEEIRGQGLLLGLKLARPHQAKDLQKALFERHILTGSSNDPQVLRLMPPLTMSSEEADLFLKTMESI
ncbi:MAG: aminotransferase class III-fold pyridoxal phosphate-dependent enzyme [Acidobacteriota bacterium]